MSPCSKWSHVTSSAKYHNNKLQRTSLRLAIKASLVCDTDSLLHDSTCASALCCCAGGILAYGAARFGRDVIPLSDEIVCTIATLLAASGAQLVGQRAGSAYAAKLSTITFLLVLLGSKDAPSKATMYYCDIILLLTSMFAGHPYSVELSMMHDMLGYY